MNYFLIIIASIIFDQATKLWIVHYFTNEIAVIPGFFNIVYYTNPGAAFSLFADIDSPLRHYFFVIIGVVALIGLSIANHKLRLENKLYSISLGLIAGGAAGNLIDRMSYGEVVDFLDFYVGRYHWPAFNIADSSIFIGVALFIYLNFKESSKEKKG